MISVVIPVFNEQDNLQPLVEEVINNIGVHNYEIIIVNDGSTDFTSIQVDELIKSNKAIKSIEFTRNFGHQTALSAGIDFAQGDAIITMDSDFQDPPELLPKMIEAWQNGKKVVFTRRNTRKDNIFKRATASVYYWFLYQFSEIKIKGHVGDYRLIDKSIVKYLRDTKERSGYLRGLISWMGHPYEILEFDRPKRKSGKSKFSLLKMSRLAMDGILNFSLFPLRLGFILGLIVIPIGLFFLGYILFDTIVNDEYYPLYKWISVATIIMQGFFFILIWILAEYINKIYDRGRDKPQYVIKNKINIE